MAYAPRHRRIARRMGGPAGPVLNRYRITDPAHKPDLRGEFAGAKVQTHGNVGYVHLTDRAARFYLDQGVLELVAPPKEEQPKEDQKRR